MKLILFLTVLNLSMPAYSYSQSAKVSLHLKNANLKDVFREIEEQTEYIFFYYEGLIDDSKVDVEAENRSVSDVLNHVLDGKGISYTINERQISLVEVEKESKEKEPDPVPTPEIDQQRITVKGVVLDEQNEPLAGVYVVIERTSRGVATGADGTFSIDVLPEDYLKFTFLGMYEQRIAIGNKRELKVIMKEKTGELAEVVIVAYGTQKKISVTGAISSVDTKELRVSSSTSLANALAGRITGLTSIQRSGGQPGRDDASLYLRGVSTTNGSAPLILIDGVPRDNIRTIDINEVESISVLKDASATAVFGVRGANGVILITTKRGQEGKPQLSINATQSYSRLTRTPVMPGSVEYMKLRNEALINDGMDKSIFTDDIIAKFENPLAGLDPNDPEYEKKAAVRRWMYPDHNWYQELLNEWSPQTIVNANMSGGTDKISYFLNVGFLHQGGNMKVLPEEILHYDPSFKLDRYSFRSNVDYKVTKWLTAYLNLGTYIEKVNMPNPQFMYGGDRNWLVRDMIYQAQTMLPISPGPLTLPGYGVPADRPLDPTYLTSGHYMDRSAVLIMNWFGYELETRSNLNSSFGLNFDLGAITKGLLLKGMISYDSNGSNYVRGQNAQTVYNAFVDPTTDELSFSIYETRADNFSLIKAQSSRYNINMQGSLEYSRLFGLHNVGAMFRTERDYWDSGGAAIPFNVLGIAGRFTYDFDTRYFAEANFGYNGSEQFSPKKRFGFFPSGSVGWAISNEEFLKDNPLLTFLKLRLSAGRVGNDKMGGTRFLYIDNITMGRGYLGSLAAGKGVSEGLLGNPNLTWEVAEKYNLGLDFAIIKDFTGQVEFFRENRSQILLSRSSVPSWQGMPLGNIPRVNMGEVLNQGYEIELGYNKLFANDLFLHFKGQLSYNRNKRMNVDEVPRDETYVYQQRSTGYPIGQSWGYLINWEQDGGYWTPESLADPERITYDFGTPRAGDFVYVDLNEDGIINDRDQAPIGSGSVPRFSYGLSLSAEWKGFDAYIFFQGLSKYNSTFAQQGTYEYTIRGTYFPYHKKAWTEERWRNGEEITYPALSTQENVNHRSNSFFVFDRSFIRLKNFEVGYTLPKNSLRILGVSDMRIFLNGQNVFTWSPKFRPGHLDPENDDSIGYPQTTVFSVGTNIKF